MKQLAPVEPIMIDVSNFSLGQLHLLMKGNLNEYGIKRVGEQIFVVDDKLNGEKLKKEWLGYPVGVGLKEDAPVVEDSVRFMTKEEFYAKR